MKTILKIALFLSFSVGFAFCKQTKPHTNKVFVFNKIETKVCAADTTQSYALYLPSSYSKDKKYPIIYVFDPHAKGSYAVERFKEAAEMYGYIIAGSNNSENGLKTLDRTLEVMITDIQQNLALDLSRQYAAGFSGGGRVASMLALKSGSIRGILTCGAGLAGVKIADAPVKFDIFAIAGKADFNYTEIAELPDQMTNSGWRYAVATFNGKHEWPPVKNITEAVLWFQLNAMRDGLIAKDDEYLESASDSFIVASDKLVDNKQLLSASEKCQTGISFLEGLTSTKKLIKLKTKIEETEAFKQEFRQNQNLLTTEQQIRDGYIYALKIQPIEWWKNELKNIQSLTELQDGSEKTQMYSRVKGYLGVACYSITNQAIANNDLDYSKRIISIYEILEPQNPDCQYFKAVFFDKQKLYREASTALQQARKLGFNNESKINSTLSAKTIQLAH